MEWLFYGDAVYKRECPSDFRELVWACLPNNGERCLHISQVMAPEQFLSEVKDVLDPDLCVGRNLGRLIEALGANYISPTFSVADVLAFYGFYFDDVLEALTWNKALRVDDYVTEEHARYMLGLCECFGFSPWYWKACLEWAKLQEHSMMLMLERTDYPNELFREDEE